MQPIKTPVSIVSTLSGISIRSSVGQRNIKPSIDLMESPSATWRKFTQPSKALNRLLMAAPFSILTLSSAVQFLKASLPILVTVFGITTATRLVHPSKARSPMDSVSGGKVISRNDIVPRMTPFFFLSYKTPLCSA